MAGVGQVEERDRPGCPTRRQQPAVRAECNGEGLGGGAATCNVAMAMGRAAFSE